MDKVLNAAQKVAAQVFSEFSQRGGVIRAGARVLSSEQAASPVGALPPLLYMLREFVEDYEMEFPVPVFRAQAQALTGVEVTALKTAGSASPAIFMLADFLRNELVPAEVHDLDLAQLLENFYGWAHDQVPGYQQPAPHAPQQTEPE